MDQGLTSTFDFTQIPAFCFTSTSPMPTTRLEPSPSSGEEDCMERIIRIVASEHGLTVSGLKGESRFRRFTRPRHVAMFLLKEAGCSYPEIGKLLGGRDHTTAMHGCRVINSLVESNNADLIGTLNRIREML